MTTIDLAPGHKHRFLAKVQITGPDECWLWSAARSDNGYGTFRIKNKSYWAHRIAAQIDGRDPDGQYVMHTCDVPDMARKGRTHVARGDLNTQTRITDEQVAVIRAEYAQGGVSQKDLATRYGVYDSTICRIVGRKSRLVPAVTVGLGAMAMALIFALPADAHTPSASATCDGVTVSGTSYEPANRNTLTVTIAGKTTTKTFGKDGILTVPVPKDGVTYQWTASTTTDNPNPAYSQTYSGSVGPCGATTPPVTSSAPPTSTTSPPATTSSPPATTTPPPTTSAPPVTTSPPVTTVPPSGSSTVSPPSTGPSGTTSPPATPPAPSTPSSPPLLSSGPVPPSTSSANGSAPAKPAPGPVGSGARSAATTTPPSAANTAAPNRLASTGVPFSVLVFGALVLLAVGFALTVGFRSRRDQR